VNVKWFGAHSITDTNFGSFDSTSAFKAALDNAYNIFIPAGTYIIRETLNFEINGSANKRTIVGEGLNSTKLYWDNYGDIVAGVNCTFNFNGLEINGITFLGSGEAVKNSNGVEVTGFLDSAPDSSYNIEFKNVEFNGWSGNGFECNHWFDFIMKACSARNIGQNGIVVSGGQSFYFEGAGMRWMSNIGYNSGAKDGYALWIKSGLCEINGFNSAPVYNGIRLGLDSTKRTKAYINGCNLEWIKPNGTGIRVERYSSILNAAGVTIYGPDGSDFTGTESAAYGIYFDRLYNYNQLDDVKTVYYTSTGNIGVSVPIYIGSYETDDSMLVLRQDKDSQIPIGDGSGGTLYVDYVQGNTVRVGKALGNRFEYTDVKRVNFREGTSNYSMVYKTGTFTPIVKGTSDEGEGTYNRQLGRYTQIGNKIDFSITLSVTDHTGTGNIKITGLPVSANWGNTFAFSVYTNNLTLPADGYIECYMLKNSDSIYLALTNKTDGKQGIAIDTSFDLDITGSYFIE
jgi:hypothetical protein